MDPLRIYLLQSEKCTERSNGEASVVVGCKRLSGCVCPDFSGQRSSARMQTCVETLSWDVHPYTSGNIPTMRSVVLTPRSIMEVLNVDAQTSARRLNAGQRPEGSSVSGTQNLNSECHGGALPCRVALCRCCPLLASSILGVRYEREVTCFLPQLLG